MARDNGPFSHVSEHLLDRCGHPGTRDGKSVREKIHEKVTVPIIENDPEIEKIFLKEEREFIVEMIRGKESRNFRRDIVSSDLDADKMDYLLRDFHFAGVQYGRYDMEKSLNRAGCIPKEINPIWQLMPRVFTRWNSSCLRSVI